MKYILASNALTSWREAVLMCDSILSGFATLKYQKRFVSSLHNSVELFLKQIMLNNSNHNVAYIRNVRGLDCAQLSCDYYRSTDLNQYFSELSPEYIDKFTSVDFKELIDSHRKIIGNNMPKNSFKSEMQLLQKLRNNEAHFMISKTTFLREEDFVTLFNFMTDFYKVIELSGLLPFWGEAWGDKKNLVFKRNRMTTFSYIDAVMNNSLAVEVVDILSGSTLYGHPGSSSYDIAYNLCIDNEAYTNRFEQICTILEMLMNNNMIRYEELIEELPEELHLLGEHPTTHDIMIIS